MMRRLLWLVYVASGLMSACPLAQEDKAAEAERLVRAGQEALDRGDFAQSISLCDQALAMDPDLHPGYLFRGLARELAGDREGAFQDYTEGRELRLDEALRPADERLEADAEDVEAHVMRGDVLYDARSLEDALASYKRAASLDAEALHAHWCVWELTGALGGSGQEQQVAFDGASEAADRVLAKNSDNALARAFRILRTCMAGGWDDQAAEDLAFVRAHAGDDPIAAIQVVVAFMGAGEYQAAVEVTDAALTGRCEPWVTANLLNGRVMCLGQMGDASGALQTAKMYVSACPFDEVAHENVAMSLLTLAEQAEPEAAAAMRGEAIAHMGFAVALNPQNPMVLYKRSCVRRFLGDAAGAQADMADAMRLDPNVEQSPELGWWIGLAQG